MASIISALQSESDETKRASLHQQLFQELQTLSSTLEEHDFLNDHQQDILHILLQDTDCNRSGSTNPLSTNTLYHVIPTVGFLVNAIDTESATKLHSNVMDIIQ